ncbi:MAG: DUF126 domain-containing protein [Candidatus Methanoliparum thermophilum]|uniref:Phosphomevalonate dehydratase small subunit n=1 Tax=Methanoliparum thermophilum TaxID=2491083 RepID=A0A520KQQ3_METT2|nr:DUF126 domain-containing protein [Candidatus Methanoliparum sp. LAM-1]RZN63846.1 MAG: DUF126 domain-containing protein [Candidatus Methanoliparum thermophilum]BDC36429.1 hypothetical protein MTLP_11110 [Candidatus Methanoliparum sp. LAM-1]
MDKKCQKCKRSGRVISHGSCEGEALVSQKDISFLGGVDPKTGIVIDEFSDIRGCCIKDKILVFPKGKGSTVGSYIILQLKKNGVAPLGIINKNAEVIVAIGAIISEIPMIEIDNINLIKTGDLVKIDATGKIGYVEITNL